MSSNQTVELPVIFQLKTVENLSGPVYLTGNFNNWSQGNPEFRMEPTSPGMYTIRLIFSSAMPERVEYKYLHKDWQGEELDQYGNTIQPRVIFPKSQPQVQDEVLRWMVDGNSFSPQYLPQIELISEEFEIPQLIKTRRISALLPYDYYSSEKRYPVLYLQDGQNLFDDFAPFGNWAVDKKLCLMAERGMGEVIVIAIDHAKEQRIAEFTPTLKTRLGTGEGKKYVRFLADTLKPYIDKKFRTLVEREHTGIGGSSMGGLISIYAGLMYPEVYGKLMIFSPSLWVAPDITSQAASPYPDFDIRMYLYGGGEEGESMIPNLQKFIGAFQELGMPAKIKYKLSIDPQGKHNEAQWGREFPKALEWLFYRQD